MSQPRNYISPEEYLAIERAAEFKSEYYCGEMFALSGGSRAHSLIGVNFVRHLANKLEGRPCEVHGRDLRIEVSESGLYTYPDAVAFCGPGEFEDEQVDVLLNPQLIVEVLSPSTEAYNRGGKFAHYRMIPTLSEYVLVAQDRVCVELYRRHDGDEFLFRLFTSRDDVLELESVGASLSLAEIYSRVEFEEATDNPKSPQGR